MALHRSNAALPRSVGKMGKMAVRGNCVSSHYSVSLTALNFHRYSLIMLHIFTVVQEYRENKAAVYSSTYTMVMTSPGVNVEQ